MIRAYINKYLVEIIDKERTTLSIKCHLGSHRFTVILVFKKGGHQGIEH